MSNNLESVNFPNPGSVTGLTSAKGDVITGDASGGLVSTTVGTDGQVLTASAAASGGVAWATAETYNSTFITASRTFPIVGTEGVATLGALGAKQMWITLWGGGGGGSYYAGGTSASGGGSGSAVVRIPINPNLSTISGETLTVTIGAGGAAGVGGSGGDGGDTTVVSTDADTTVDLTAYGGGGGEEDDNQGGGGGGTGGAATGSTGGIANTKPSGGGTGPDGSPNGSPASNTDDQVIIGYWWTGVTGGTGGGGAAVDRRGSHFFGRGRGGAQLVDVPVFETHGGGAGGYNGDGGNAAVPGGSAAANSGAGGGGCGNAGPSTDGGAGGSGGCIIEWI